MPTRPVLLLVPVVGLLLAFIAPDQPREMAETRRGRGGAATAQAVGPWGSARSIGTLLEEAEVWAAEALKRGRSRRPYLLEPDAIPSTAEAVTAIIARDGAKAMATLGAKDPAARAALATRIANHVLAVYDPDTGTIHVLPENARRAAEAAGDPGLANRDTLRLLLVRMCLVALLRQHHPEWKEALDAADSLDALHAAAAVFHGRVQVQTRRVAGEIHAQDPRFEPTTPDALVTLLTASVADDADPALRAFVEGVRFAVLKGEHFMTNVPRAFHDDLIDAPPSDRGTIQDPEGFTQRKRDEAKRGPVRDLPGKLQGAFTAEIMAEGTWTHGAEEVDADRAAALLAPIEPRLFATAMAAYAWGHVQESRPAEGADGPVTEVWLLEFRSDGQAENFRNVLRSAAKARGGALKDGAGRDLGLAGFHGSVPGEGEAPKRWVQWASEGRFVLGFRTTADLDDEETRLVWDEALEAAAEDVATVAGSRDSRRRNRGR